MIKWLHRLYRDDEAATAVEYAVLLALILMGVIAAIGTVGSQTGGLWGGIEVDLNSTRFGNPSGG
jgi:pilus assembly protein Flp/PilA